MLRPPCNRKFLNYTQSPSISVDLAGFLHVRSRTVVIPDAAREALTFAANTLRTCAPEQRQTILNYINNILDWINSR